jgi:hypothetical protein
LLVGRFASWSSTAGLVLFALVDAALIAYIGVHGDQPVSTASGTVPHRTERVSTGPSPSATPTATPRPHDQHATGYLVDAVPGYAVRVRTTEDCVGPGSKAQASTDGGKTWHDADLPAAHVLRLRSVKPGDFWVVTADKSCTPAFYETTDGGEHWSKTANISGAWSLLPGDGAAVHAPYKKVTPTCPKESTPTLLGGVTLSLGYVACAGSDGTATALLVTHDGGSSWKRVGGAPLDGLLAMAWPSSSHGYLLNRSTTGGCVNAHADTAGMAVTTAGDGLVVTGRGSNAATYATTDDGRTWAKLP